MSRSAGKSNKSKGKQVSKGKRSGQRVFTFRDLAIPPRATFEEYLVYLSEHPDLADDLLRPGEQWAIEIFGNKTYVPFSTAALFRPGGYLDRYDGLMANAKDPHKTDELIRNVRIVKVGEPSMAEEALEDQYRAQREEEKQAAENVVKKAEKVFKTPEAKEGRRPSRVSLLKSALDTIDDYAKRLRKLERKFAEIEKARKKPARKKRVVKKAPPKKPAKKAPPKKPAKKAPPKKHVTKKSIHPKKGKRR